MDIVFSWKNTLLTKNLPGSLKKNTRCKSNSFSVCLQLLVPRSMLNAMMEAMACPAWEMAPDECPSIGDGVFFEGCSPCCVVVWGGTEFFSPVSFHFVPLCSHTFCKSSNVCNLFLCSEFITVQPSTQQVDGISSSGCWIIMDAPSNGSSTHSPC